MGNDVSLSPASRQRSREERNRRSRNRAQVREAANIQRALEASDNVPLVEQTGTIEVCQGADEWVTTTFLANNKGELVIDLGRTKKIINIPFYDHSKSKIAQHLRNFPVGTKLPKKKRSKDDKLRHSYWFIPRGEKIYVSFDGVLEWDGDFWAYIEDGLLSRLIHMLRGIPTLNEYLKGEEGSEDQSTSC